MGLFSNMRLAGRLARPDVIPFDTPLSVGTRTRLSLPNPWAGSPAGSLAWQSDIFGDLTSLMTRQQAMTIPGVARGRAILISLIADKPLVNYRSDATGNTTRTEVQPAWLYRVPGWQGPYQRMVGTLDDHIFYGESLWGVQRGAVTRGLKPILQAWHIPYDLWKVDEVGRICVMDEDGHFMPADEEEVVYIPASHDGLLSYASRTMRGAVDLEQAWIARAKNPIPALDLHETEETNLTVEERQEIVNDWAAARHDVNGAVASTPYNIDARVLGTIDANLYIEGRNAVRLDIANFFALPAALLDATTATASLTYTTQESSQNSVDSMTIPYWVRSIEDRLSQDDVVPMGNTVRFAWAEALTEPPGVIITGTPDIAPVVVDAAVERTLSEEASA